MQRRPRRDERRCSSRFVGWAKRSVPTTQCHAGERWWARFALPTLRLCPCVKQPGSFSPPSLRGAKRRSNSSLRMHGGMDCFASLAMTDPKPRTHTKTSRGATRPRICHFVSPSRKFRGRRESRVPSAPAIVRRNAHGRLQGAPHPIVSANRAAAFVRASAPILRVCSRSRSG